ncbi:MAG: Ig-like domain-containing protein [Candidatus Neomarinimicrobiota bacterium]
MAFDSEGLSTISAQIAVHLDNYDNIFPNGYIQNPAPGQIVTGITAIEVIAEDNVGINQVEIFINGELISNLDSIPYTYEWNTSQDIYEDEYIYIHTNITDLSGNILSTVPIMVYVNNIPDEDITFPTGSISYPISGQTVNGVVSFSVYAFDNSGISEVNFLVGDGISVTDNEAPYVYEWDTSSFASGDEVVLSASITDNSDNTTTLQPIMVIIE